MMEVDKIINRLRKHIMNKEIKMLSKGLKKMLYENKPENNEWENRWKVTGFTVFEEDPNKYRVKIIEEDKRQEQQKGE